MWKQLLFPILGNTDEPGQGQKPRIQSGFPTWATGTLVPESSPAAFQGAPEQELGPRNGAEP